MTNKFNPASTISSVRNVVSLLAAFTMALAWLIPNHYPPWTSFYNDGCMAIALLLFVLSQPIGRQSTGMPGVAWFVIGIIAIPWLQWAFGLLLFSGDAWVSTLYLLGFAIAISTGHAWAGHDAKKFATLLASATLAGACISSVLGLIQTLHGDVLGVWGHTAWPGMRAEGNLAQPNNLGTLMGFGAVSLLLLHEQGQLGKASSACVLGLLLIGAALTQSRTALLFGIAISGVLFLFSKRHPGVLKTRLPTVVVATALHWGMTWIWPILEKSLLLSPTQSLDERGATNRLAAWRLFVGAINHAPWAGWGWLQSGTAQLAMAERYPPVGELFAETHNLFLELLVWCGYPLGIFLCLVIVYWFATRLRKISTIESLCGLLTVTVLCVHSMLEWPFHYAYFLVPTGFWIGMIDNAIGVRCILSTKWRFGIIVTAASLLLLISREYLAIEDDFRLARFESLKIGYVNTSKAAPDTPFLSNLSEYSRFYRTRLVANMNNDELEGMLAITKRYPYAKLLLGYSEAAALNGRMQEAIKTFFKIKLLYGEGLYRSFKEALQQEAMGDRNLKELATSLK